MHRFDEARAQRFFPREGVEKIAVLVRTTDPNAETEIDTAFGRQRLRGEFYAVADDDASYGAARSEFEATHRSVGPNRWVKSEPVLAYRAEEPCVVETVISDHLEGTVQARPGDWIVRQQTGELMVIDDDEFSERYVGEGSDAAPR